MAQDTLTLHTYVFTFTGAEHTDNAVEALETRGVSCTADGLNLIVQASDWNVEFSGFWVLVAKKRVLVHLKPYIVKVTEDRLIVWPT